MKRMAGVSLFVCTLLSGRGDAQFFLQGQYAAELQPNIPNGGRANTIAVSPLHNDMEILVASDSGGLFHSFDRGKTWTHVDSLPEYATRAVTFLPAHPNIVLATTDDDFRAVGGAGIWRSVDDGVTWTHMSVPVAVPSLPAYDISIAPDTGKIYVGTLLGVAMSVDDGATWTHMFVNPGPDPRVLAIAANKNGVVIAAGSFGIRRSVDGGSTWTPATAGPGPIYDLHGVARSPLSSTDAYAVTWYRELWYTEDAGDHWKQITGAPISFPTCGGFAFVKAIGSSSTVNGVVQQMITLYESNKCDVSRLTTPPLPASSGFDYSGSWTFLNKDHVDTRDLAFDRFKTPMLLATDGGLHNTTDGGLTWHFVGGGKDGYNALQIAEVKGQWITTTSAHDLYFGTQDNDLWASGDGGTSWTNHVCCEGFFIQNQHRVAAAANSKTTFVRCSGCINLLADPVFANTTLWTNPPSAGTSNPTIVEESFHVQGVDSSGTSSSGFAVTQDLGKTWQPYVSFPETRRDLPKLSDPGTRPVLYQAIKMSGSAGGHEIDHLARITKDPVGMTATVTYPLMNSFGGLGVTPTMWVDYQVFGVDPANTLHVIAPDTVNDKMMETWDGGDNWNEIPFLTSQVTDSGNFSFHRGWLSFVSAVSFCPDDPNLVAIGTWQNGIFVSSNRGASWSKVPGSEHATWITSIEWSTASAAIVSTYGRGLWFLSWTLTKPLVSFPAKCERCKFQPWPVQVDPAERYTQAVVVFNGTIQGGKIAGRQLKELVVSPGSSVVFFSDAQPPNIGVSESAKISGFGSVAPPPSPERQALRGFTLDRTGQVLAVVSSAEQLKLYEPTPDEQNQDRPVGTVDSPTAGRPYVHIDGDARIPLSQSFGIFARSLPPGIAVEIAIDGTPVRQLRSGDDGTLRAKLEAPPEFGTHFLTVKDVQGERILDGTAFHVVHVDEANP